MHDWGMICYGSEERRERGWRSRTHRGEMDTQTDTHGKQRHEI